MFSSEILSQNPSLSKKNGTGVPKNDPDKVTTGLCPQDQDYGRVLDSSLMIIEVRSGRANGNVVTSHAYTQLSGISDSLLHVTYCMYCERTPPSISRQGSLPSPT